jgi:DNA-binding protein H-NS
MNLEELKRQKVEIEERIKLAEGMEEAREKIRTEAQKLGYSIEELFGESSNETSMGERRSRKKAMYQNPTNKRQTWSGDSDEPQWVLDWVASGKNIEDARFPGR